MFAAGLLGPNLVLLHDTFSFLEQPPIPSPNLSLMIARLLHWVFLGVISGSGGNVENLMILH